MNSLFAASAAHAPGARPDHVGVRRPHTSGSRCVNCATRRFCVIGSLPQGPASVGPLVRERSFRSGEMLSREGETGSDVRILKVGMAFVCRDSQLGHCRPIAIIATGAVFGILSYLGVRDEVSVVAATSGRCCELAAERVQSLARNHAPLRDGLPRIYADTMAILAMWAEALGCRGGTAQVATTMLLLAGTQRTTSITMPAHTILAELLGTTRESVARALAVLETARCLTRTSLHRCEIDPVALRAWLAEHR